MGRFWFVRILIHTWTHHHSAGRDEAPFCSWPLTGFLKGKGKAGLAPGAVNLWQKRTHAIWHLFHLRYEQPCVLARVFVPLWNRWLRWQVERRATCAVFFPACLADLCGLVALLCPPRVNLCPAAWSVPMSAVSHFVLLAHGLTSAALSSSCKEKSESRQKVERRTWPEAIVFGVSHRQAILAGDFLMRARLIRVAPFENLHRGET